MEEITDAEVSQTLGMIEQLLQGHLEELRVIRENAAGPRAERGVGPDGVEDEEGIDGEGEDDDDDDLEVLISGRMSPSEWSPSNSQTRGRSPSPPQEYHGMYS